MNNFTVLFSNKTGTLAENFCRRKPEPTKLAVPRNYKLQICRHSGETNHS
jgi:hypothetical protein